MNSDNPLEVRFFKSESGKEPVRDLLQKLDKTAKKIIGEDIKTVQYGGRLGCRLFGNLKTGYGKSVLIWKKNSASDFHGC